MLWRCPSGPLQWSAASLVLVRWAYLQLLVAGAHSHPRVAVLEDPRAEVVQARCRAFWGLVALESVLLFAAAAIPCPSALGSVSVDLRVGRQVLQLRHLNWVTHLHCCAQRIRVMIQLARVLGIPRS